MAGELVPATPRLHCQAAAREDVDAHATRRGHSTPEAGDFHRMEIPRDRHDHAVDDIKLLRRGLQQLPRHIERLGAQL